MHGKYPERVNRSDIDKESTYKWLKSSSLKGKTEEFIIAGQNQSLATNNYRNKVIKDGTNPKCRLCHDYDETIEHITSTCIGRYVNITMLRCPLDGMSINQALSLKGRMW